VVSVGIVSVRSRWVSRALIALVFLLSLYPLSVLYSKDLNIQWRDAVAFLNDHKVREGQAIIISPSLELAPFLYYFAKSPDGALRNFDTIFDCRVSGGHCLDVFDERNDLIIGIPQDRGEGINFIKSCVLRRLKVLHMSNPEVVWLLVSRWTGVEEKELLLLLLKENYNLTQTGKVRGIEIFKFEALKKQELSKIRKGSVSLCLCDIS
jgi:hypothetical protein